MPDSYLIDGYNLIHALGLIRKHMAAGGLEASRRKLLDYLVERFAGDAVHVTVVFDAQGAPRGAARNQGHRSIAVRFAPKKQSADDLIETLIEEAAEPTKLVVVSNDMRLQNAAHRRGTRAWSHEALLDFLDERHSAKPKPAAFTEETKDEVSPAEAKRWLKEFGDVENDPDLREFFEHDRFE